MKAYRIDYRFFAPGTQPKGAEKLDIPTDSHGLVCFLNDLVASVQADASVGNRMRAIAIQEAQEPDPASLELTRPPKAPQAPAEPPRITDEAFEALPLPYQLHLAALALENARTRVGR